MSDDLVKLCRRLSRYAHAQLSATTLERIADRIEKLEAELRQLTEAGKAQAKQADLSAGLSNSVNDTAP
jgi:hypothetical protein